MSYPLARVTWSYTPVGSTDVGFGRRTDVPLTNTESLRLANPGFLASR